MKIWGLTDFAINTEANRVTMSGKLGNVSIHKGLITLDLDPRGGHGQVFVQFTERELAREGYRLVRV